MLQFWRDFCLWMYVSVLVPVVVKGEVPSMEKGCVSECTYVHVLECKKVTEDT